LRSKIIISAPQAERSPLHRKTEYPIRGCRAAETVDLTEPFEPDTGNTGEGSLKVTEFFRGCRTFTAEDVRLSFLEKLITFPRISENIG
jgi:hypothetical protein